VKRLAVLVAAMCLATTATAELTPDQRLQLLVEARTAYTEGIDALRSDPVAAATAFGSSAQRYRQLVDDGIVNGQLLYNLGNAHLQKGDVGEAILAYRAAEQLIPGDPRLAHNLEYARSLRHDHIAASGRRQLADALLVWHRGSATQTRFGVFVAGYAVFWIVLTVNLFAPRVAWRWTAGAAAVLWLATGVSLAVEHLAPDRQGVIVADEVIVRKGNGEGFAPLFEQPLHEGVEFHLIEQRAGWLHVELDNGSSGWIPADQAGLI
jgi:hypothetical protein